MKYSIRLALKDDCTAIAALLPRLADFPVPAVRHADDLWTSDRDMLFAWQRGDSDCLIHVADDSSGILGVTMVTLREEMLSHEPSAHLEVLVLASAAEGHGIGRALLQQAQRAARDAGAGSMSLHVFSTNTRARKLYERAGFDGELMRYYKPL